MSKLCPHVTLDIDKKSRVVTATGPIFPYFAWSKKLQADTPRLKCSDCGKYVQIRGYIVKHNSTPDFKYSSSPKENPRDKTATRSKARKKDTGKVGGETWGFVE